jgi:hypothetical protein
MRSRLLVVVALACGLSLAPPAHAAWPAALERWLLGLEGGVAMPLEPGTFTQTWDDSRGVGVVLGYALAPTRTLVLRVETDRFEFENRSHPGATVIGSDARFVGVTVGHRWHQDIGPLRGHATLYAGTTHRSDLRATVDFMGNAFPIGEDDRWLTTRGLGAGVRLAIPRVPDLTLEARCMWNEPGEMFAPVRVGVVVP